MVVGGRVGVTEVVDWSWSCVVEWEECGEGGQWKIVKSGGGNVDGMTRWF